VVEPASITAWEPAIRLTSQNSVGDVRIEVQAGATVMPS
jgi:hypothetical protein